MTPYQIEAIVADLSEMELAALWEIIEPRVERLGLIDWDDYECAGCDELQAEVDELKLQVADLEDEIEELEEKAKPHGAAK